MNSSPGGGPFGAPAGDGPCPRRVDEIAVDALELPRDERAAFVARACAGDAALRAEVERLLSADRDDGFLEGLVVTIDAPFEPVAEAAATEIASGALLVSRYRLGERLASGSFGVVHRACDELLQQEVALKVLRPQVAGDALGTWRREIGILRLLRLPGVVQILDEGGEAGAHFLVTELVEGASFPGRDAGCAWAEIASTVMRLLETLARVHHAGVLHRDLKPGNVLVDVAGAPTLIDLGLAIEPVSRSVSGTEQVVGSPAYMAPELFRGELASVRSDLYAVGMMVYQALAGRHPDAGRGLPELIALRVHRDLPSLAGSAPAAPARVVAWVDALLRREPRARPASAEAALELLGADPSALACRELLRERRRAAGQPDRLREEDLQPLFHGPERLLHFPSHAAHELWIRTAGEQELLVREVSAWIRAGIAMPKEERLAITPGALERLRGGLRVATPAGAAREPELTPRLRRLLVLVDLAGAYCTAELLHTLSGDAARLAADLEELERGGWIARLPQGRLLCLRRAPTVEGAGRSFATSLAALAAAQPAGTRARLVFLAGAGEREAIPPEALRLAERYAHEGRLPEAEAALCEGLFAARASHDAGEHELLLLQRLLEYAFQAQTPRALDRALSQLGRATAPDGVRLARLQELGRGGLLAKVDPQRAGALLDGLPEFSPPSLERWRLATRILAARFAAARCAKDQTREQRVVEEALAWAAPRREPELISAAHGWLGWREYRAGRFRAAARAHAACAASAVHAALRMAAELNGASAWLEAGDCERAEALARGTLTRARQLRAANYEVRAEWLLRCAAYRRGSSQAPDRELVDAAERWGGSRYAGLIALNEAAVAWRSGRSADARLLAISAQTHLAHLPPHFAALPGALACVAGAATDLPELRRLAEVAARCTLPAITLQILALLSLVWPGERERLRERAASRGEAARLPHPEVRREVLSPAEAWALLAGAHPPGLPAVPQASGNSRDETADPRLPDAWSLPSD